MFFNGNLLELLTRLDYNCKSIASQEQARSRYNSASVRIYQFYQFNI